ncbi:hypothetical protein AQF52_6602 [Streptomyces venezuelae]|nr:hypothetical protein AQF52_6602 [Streptomyces venezuelae]
MAQCDPGSELAGTRVDPACHRAGEVPGLGEETRRLMMRTPCGGAGARVLRGGS